MSWHHRTHTVEHGRDGFSLRVCDAWVPGLVAERAVGLLLDALGHPCCDRGPLARVHVSYRALRRLGIGWGGPDVDEDGDTLDLDDNALLLFWFRVLNLPNRLCRRDRHVASVALSDEQALAIEPAVAGWAWVWERDDENEDD